MEKQTFFIFLNLKIDVFVSVCTQNTRCMNQRTMPDKHRRTASGFDFPETSYIDSLSNINMMFAGTFFDSMYSSLRRSNQSFEILNQPDGAA